MGEDEEKTEDVSSHGETTGYIPNYIDKRDNIYSLLMVAISALSAYDSSILNPSIYAMTQKKQIMTVERALKLRADQMRLIDKLIAKI